MASFPGMNRISLQRLRASLALILPGEDADAISAGLDETPDLTIDALRQIVRAAQLRALRHRVTSWLLRSRHRGVDAPETQVTQLRSHPTDAALSLCLHVGCGAPVDVLASAFDVQRDQLARELFRARLELLGLGSTQCDGAIEELGGYRDAEFDLNHAAALSRHQAKCGECASLLADFEVLDEQILRDIRQIEEALPATPPIARGLHRRLVAAAPIALIVACVGVAALVSAGLASNLIGQGAVPLYAAPPTSEAGQQGYIIYGTWDGGMIAFDPATGERQVLLAEYFTSQTQSGANYLVSPDGQRVAIFAQNEVAGLHWATRHVRISSIHGELINEIEWQNSLEAGWPTGWLGNDEILIASIPVYEGGETTERFLERLEAEGRVRAVNVETGEQRVIFRGATAQVIPSPDASRLAIIRPRNPSEPGTTVEIWSVVDGVAQERVDSLDDRFLWTGGLLWSHDSEALYLGRIADFEDRRDENNRDDAFRGRVTSLEIVRLGRDGTQEVVVTADEPWGHRLVGLNPQGEQIVLSRFSMLGSDDPHEILVLDQRDETLEPLELPRSDLRFRPTQTGTLGYHAGFVAHPEGFPYLLHLGTEHYLRADPTHHAHDPPESIYLTTVDAGANLSVSTIISDRWPLSPLAWVEADEIELEQPVEIDHARTASAPEPVDEIRPYAQLGSDSTPSPDGTALPMVEVEDDAVRPYLWFPSVHTGRWVASQTREITWNASSHSFLGVTELGTSGHRFRVTQHGTSQRGGTSIDGFFDPLTLDEGEGIRYAAPAASPDASRTSVFTVDEAENTVALWITDWLSGTESVHEFSYPSDAEGSIEPISAWLDDDSLIFVEPLAWSDGLPVEVSLNRVAFDDSGVWEITGLLELRATGRDRGIDIVEIAIHPDGDYFAYRQRHYTDQNDADSGYDTVHVTSSADLNEGIEINRADKSSGLAWSPGGQALALGSSGRVGVYSVVSHTFSIVSEGGRISAYPAWISDHELWFNVGQQENATVYRVRFEGS